MNSSIFAPGAQHNTAMAIYRVFHVIRCGLRLVYIVVNNLYCIPTYLLWGLLFLYPMRIVQPQLYWYIEGTLFRWMLCTVASWSWGANYYLVELGEDVSSCIGQRCLILVNHQSTGDVPLLMTAFQNKAGVLESVMWIMDRLFRYTNFGLCAAFRGDFFIAQGKNVRSTQLKKLEDHLFDVYLGRMREWIVLFPEGGFLRKRKETSQRYAKKNNYPCLEHVTLPRVGAMYTIINTLRPGKLKGLLDRRNSPLGKKIEPLKWVIDITIGYPDKDDPIGLPAICSSYRPSCTTYLHYRRYPIEDVPEDMESMQAWLYDRWVEKEHILDEYYRTGQFPHKTTVGDNNSNSYKLLSQPTKVVFSDFYIAFCHLFYIASSFIHFYILRRLWQYMF